MSWPPKLEMVTDSHIPEPRRFHCRCDTIYYENTNGLGDATCPSCGWDPFSWVREIERQNAQEVKNVLYGEEEEP